MLALTGFLPGSCIRAHAQKKQRTIHRDTLARYCVEPAVHATLKVEISVVKRK
jgi:hypothetical protein